jgi:hypothetical protein
MVAWREQERLSDSGVLVLHAVRMFLYNAVGLRAHLTDLRCMGPHEHWTAYVHGVSEASKSRLDGRELGSKMFVRSFDIDWVRDVRPNSGLHYSLLEGTDSTDNLALASGCSYLRCRSNDGTPPPGLLRLRFVTQMLAGRVGHSMLVELAEVPVHTFRPVMVESPGVAAK